MCEFSVLFRGKEVIQDIIYAKAEGNNVTLRDVLGGSKTVEDCRITEVDVGSERLVLSPTKASQ
jgi:predicted RNA-binding protein